MTVAVFPVYVMLSVTDIPRIVERRRKRKSDLLVAGKLNESLPCHRDTLVHTYVRSVVAAVHFVDLVRHRVDLSLSVVFIPEQLVYRYPEVIRYRRDQFEVGVTSARFPARNSLTGYAGGIGRKMKLLALEKADMSSLYVPRKGTAL